MSNAVREMSSSGWSCDNWVERDVRRVVSIVREMRRDVRRRSVVVRVIRLSLERRRRRVKMRMIEGRAEMKFQSCFCSVCNGQVSLMQA